jgi:hypothetical protein
VHVSDCWDDCDTLTESIERLDCRTSKLNDGFHHLRSVMGMSHTLQDHGQQLKSVAGEAKRDRYVLALCTPIIGALLAAIFKHFGG